MKFATRKQRKLSAWNVFQREKLKETSLEPGEYKQHVAELSKEWKSMSEQDQAAFAIQAEFESQLRKQASTIPLAPKGCSRPEVDGQIGTSALKKLSVVRLQQNFQNASDHVVWKSTSQLGECCLAWGENIFSCFLLFLVLIKGHCDTVCLFVCLFVCLLCSGVDRPKDPKPEPKLVLSCSCSCCSLILFAVCSSLQ